MSLAGSALRSAQLIRADDRDLEAEDNAANVLAHEADWDTTRLRAAILELRPDVLRPIVLREGGDGEDELEEEYDDDLYEDLLEATVDEINLAVELLELAAQIAEREELHTGSATRDWALSGGEDLPGWRWNLESWDVPSTRELARIARALSERGWPTKLSGREIQVVPLPTSALGARFSLVAFENYFHGGVILRRSAFVRVHLEPTDPVEQRFKRRAQQQWDWWKQTEPDDPGPFPASHTFVTERAFFPSQLVTQVADNIEASLKNVDAAPPEVLWSP